jgi:pimeloyl-ACP methyl ester carboxylesterase
MPAVTGVEHQQVDIGELNIHVASVGSGPPLVLLHGWPQNWFCWRRVIPMLCADHRLIIPDLRGHGWSDAPEHGYDKEQLATDLFALLDVMQLDVVGLIGHDWGGWVGFLAALREPRRIQALLALGIIHPFQRLTLPKALQAWRGTYQLALSTPILAEATLRVSPHLVSSAVRSGTVRHEALTPDYSRLYGEIIQEPARAHASVQMYRTFLRSELPHLGRYSSMRLEPRTHLMIGRGDPIFHRALLDGWQDRADDMTVDVIPDAGHFLPEEIPAQVAVAARQLFDEHR